MTKILIISYEFPPIIGGAGTYSRELAVGLGRIGNEVHVVTCEQAGYDCHKEIDRQLAEEGVIVHRFRAYGKLFFMQLGAFLRKKWGKEFQNSFDYIILSDSRATRYAVLQFNARQLKKSAHIFHGGELDSFYRNPNIRVRLAGIHKNFVGAMKKSAALITVCNDLKNDFYRTIPELRGSVHTVYHGIDSKVFKPISEFEKQEFRISHSIAKDELLVVSASRLTLEKGQDNLIEAVNFLIQDGRKIKLMIIGDGAFKYELEAMVKNNNLQNTVHFIGALSREELAGYIAAADLFAMVSRRKNETFGLVYIEANACRVPVLAGNYAGVPESVADGISGLLADPFDSRDIADKLNSFLNAPYRSQLAEKAYKRFIERFTCEIMAENTLKTIQKLNYERND